jgi:hypothetical protein
LVFDAIEYTPFSLDTQQKKGAARRTGKGKLCNSTEKRGGWRKLPNILDKTHKKPYVLIRRFNQLTLRTIKIKEGKT